MRIAQVAPLTEAVPPRLYGGTERVVYWLTEELVALGHEVTLDLGLQRLPHVVALASGVGQLLLRFGDLLAPLVVRHESEHLAKAPGVDWNHQQIEQADQKKLNQC